jgi:hypothetical protein
MIKYAIAVMGICLFACNSPMHNENDFDKEINYYNDLPKGTESILTADENGVINAIVEYYAKGETGEIILISDSTEFSALDTSRMSSKDTFPDTLVKALKQINDKRYYWGNCSLSLSFDYRYISQAYQSKISGANTNYWPEFHKRFPKSEMGILSFSKIAINADSKRALAFAMWATGGWGVGGGIFSLKKENGKWNVIDYVITLFP